MLSAGTLFDDTYRLIRLIGEGAMGSVYEATHARLDGRYVIKVLQQALSTNTEALAAFHREARITSLLQHPNIVQIVDHNTTAEGIDYLVMEYLPGETLTDRLLRTGPLPLETVAGIIEQIAAGLAAAHAHGIVHRDLKPDNVFLVPVEGRDAESVKILDFGISKVKDPSWGLQVPEGTVVGTPLYMSPEQVEGRVADADAATDQFALAVIGYEMLTGRNPFQAESLSKIFSRVSYGDPTTMDIGRDVELVVRRGLAKQNRQRFPSVTDFSEALRAAAVGRARESQRSALVAYAACEVAYSQSEGKSRRHNRGLVLGVGVLVSIAIAFGVGKATPGRWSRVQAGAAAVAPKDLPGTVEPLATKPVERPVIEEIEAAQEPTPPPEVMPSPEMVPPPARRADRSPLAAPDGRPNHPSRTGLAAPRRSRSALVPFPVDEDATMPASEP